MFELELIRSIIAYGSLAAVMIGLAFFVLHRG